MNLVVEDIADLEYTVNSLSTIGYDNIAGYLKGGMYPWISSGHPYESLPLLKASDLKEKIEHGEKLTLLDVRGPDEWDQGHLRDARRIYVGHLPEQLEKVSEEHPVVTICSTGRRASIAASILQRCGRSNVINLLGGMEAWVAAGYPTETGVKCKEATGL